MDNDKECMIPLKTRIRMNQEIQKFCQQICIEPTSDQFLFLQNVCDSKQNLLKLISKCLSPSHKKILESIRSTKCLSQKIDILIDIWSNKMDNDTDNLKIEGEIKTKLQPDLYLERKIHEVIKAYCIKDMKKLIIKFKIEWGLFFVDRDWIAQFNENMQCNNESRELVLESIKAHLKIKKINDKH